MNIAMVTTDISSVSYIESQVGGAISLCSFFVEDGKTLCFILEDGKTLCFIF